MSDEHKDLSNSFVTVLQNSPPLKIQPQAAPRKKPSKVFPLFLKLVIGISSLTAFGGLMWLGNSVRAGGIAIVLSLAVNLGCFIWLDHLQDQRKVSKEEENRSLRRASLRYDAETGLMIPSLSYLSPISKQVSPQVEAIRAIKEVELSKMSRAASFESQTLASQTTIKVTELTTQAQVETSRVQAHATIESAKYTAMGASGLLNHEKELIKLKEQLVADEAAREREYRASENALDRDLTMSQIITKLQGQIEVLETRMKYERPSADIESQEELIRLKSDMAHLEEIQKLEKEKPVLYKQLLDRYMKDKHKRRD